MVRLINSFKTHNFLQRILSQIAKEMCFMNNVLSLIQRIKSHVKSNIILITTKICQELSIDILLAGFQDLTDQVPTPKQIDQLEVTISTLRFSLMLIPKRHQHVKEMGLGCLTLRLLVKYFGKSMTQCLNGKMQEIYQMTSNYFNLILLIEKIIL